MLENQPEATATVSAQDNNLQDLFNILWEAKFLIAVVAFSFSLAGALYAFTQPNIYKAQTLIAPSEEPNGGALSSMANQFGGLASLAGVNLGKGGVDKAAMSLAVLKSRSFIVEFVHRRHISQQLLAAEGWTGEELVIDQSLFDSTLQEWDESLLHGNSKTPSDWDLYNEFKNILQVSQDKSTGLVTVSIEHISPVVAKDWVTWLVEDLNSHIRSKDVNEAKTSVVFLEEQLKKTPVADMQTMFYQLIEKQYQTIMLANVREEYMFKVIDPAAVPQEKFKPKRGLFIVVSMLVGILFGFTLALIRAFRRKA